MTTNTDKNMDSYSSIAPVAGIDGAGDFSAAVHTTSTAYLPPTTLYLTEKGDTSAISVNDLHDDHLGDSFLIASIGELALNDPSFISHMIVQNPYSGAFSVKLFQNGTGALQGEIKAVNVVVGSTFPTNSVNSGATQDVVGSQKEIWPQVLENAFADFTSGYPTKAFAYASTGYQMIGQGGSAAAAMTTLAGCPASSSSASQMSLNDLNNAVKAHDLVVLDTPNKNNLPDNLIGNRSYMFEGVTGTGNTAMVHVAGPWTGNQPSLIPFSQFSQSFAKVDIGFMNEHF